MPILARVSAYLSFQVAGWAVPDAIFTRWILHYRCLRRYSSSPSYPTADSPVAVNRTSSLAPCSLEHCYTVIYAFGTSGSTAFYFASVDPSGADEAYGGATVDTNSQY